MRRKTAELIISGGEIAELRTPPDWQFIRDMRRLPDVIDERGDIHRVPDGVSMDVLEIANQHFKLKVKRLCVECAWFGRLVRTLPRCAAKCAHLGNGGDLFLF